METSIRAEDIHFELASPKQRSLIEEWLSQEHVSKILKNLNLNKTIISDLELFFNTKSIKSYWIGYYKMNPFSLIIRSPEKNSITVDYIICNIHYIGKGLLIPLMQSFQV